jgi:hypothetical protein
MRSEPQISTASCCQSQPSSAGEIVAPEVELIVDAGNADVLLGDNETKVTGLEVSNAASSARNAEVDSSPKCCDAVCTCSTGEECGGGGVCVNCTCGVRIG